VTSEKFWPLKLAIGIFSTHRQYFLFLHGFLLESAGMDQIPEDSSRHGPESTGILRNSPESTGMAPESTGIDRNSPSRHYFLLLYNLISKLPYLI